MPIDLLPILIDLKTLSDPGDVAKIEWRPKIDLFIDDSYQRDMTSRRSRALIQNIGQKFTWRKAGIWQTTLKGAIVDGQHRHAGVMLRPDITNLPCMVWNMPVNEAAAMFVGLNRDRVMITQQATYKAELAAGDPLAVAVQAVAEEAGVQILTYPCSVKLLKPNQTTAVQTLKHQVGFDPKRCRQTLECCLKSRMNLTSTVMMMVFRELTLGGPVDRVMRMLGSAAANYVPRGHLPPASNDVAPSQLTPGVKRYENGTFMDILLKTFQRTEIKLEVRNSGVWKAAEFRFDDSKTWVDLRTAVERANILRAASGYAPLTIPRG